MGTGGANAAPRVLGLTGPIACGKTTVGTMLLELGASARIDADEVVHELMLPGTETSARIAAEFGPGVILPGGGVDRRALGALVFAQPAALRRLEAITHPAVRELIRARLKELSGGNGIVLLDAVKLLQSELADLCSTIWVVRCDQNEQRRRLLEDRGMDPTQADGRLAAQPSFEDPRVSAVIDNSGSRAHTREQVVRHWQQLQGELLG